MNSLRLQTEIFTIHNPEMNGMVGLLLVGKVFLRESPIVEYKLRNYNRIKDSSDVTGIDLVKFQFQQLVKDDLKTNFKF